MPNHIKPKIMA